MKPPTVELREEAKRLAHTIVSGLSIVFDPGYATRKDVITVVAKLIVDSPLCARAKREALEPLGSILSEPFHAGSRVTNCVAHIGRPITERPDWCELCLTDLRNHMNFAIRVNEFLNRKVDAALAALDAEAGDGGTKEHYPREGGKR